MSEKECKVINKIDGGGQLAKCEVCFYCKYFNIETKLCNIYAERLKGMPDKYFIALGDRTIEIKEYSSFQCSYWEDREERDG